MENVEKDKLEARMKKLKVLKASIGALLGKREQRVDADKVTRLKMLTAALNDIERLRKSKIQGSKKVLDKCANELTSLREGIFIGAARKKSDLVLSTCKQAIEDCDNLMASTTISIKKLVAADTGEDPENDEGLRKIIQDLNHESSKLPSIAGKPYVVGRAPVVIVDSLNRAKLEKAGFAVTRIGEYTVLQNQRLFGLGKNFIKNKETVEQAAERFIKALNAATKNRFTLATPKGYMHAGAVWFWFLPERDLDRVRGSVMGNGKLHKWGLA